MSSTQNTNQNVKPTMLIGIAVAVALSAAGFVFLSAAPSEPSPVVAAPAPAPASAAAQPQRAAAPVHTTEASSPSVDPSQASASASPREPSKNNRLASDLTREQVWSALGRKHSLKPAAPGSAAPSESAAALLPSLDKNYVRDSIKEQLVPVAVDCYSTVLQRDPELGGSLVFNFTIIGDEEIGGVVEAVSLGEDSTLDDEFLRECLSESLLAVTFPPPPEGGRVEVSYPMHFEPE